METRTILILVTTALLGAGLVGCSGNEPGAEDGRLTVVTSFYPLEEVARAVGDGEVTVQDLTPPGVEPHDLELSSDQIDDILDADVVLYLGGGFQPAVEDAVQQRDSDQVTVDVLDQLGSAVHPPAAGAAEGNETADPHVWLDPTLMEQVTHVVARTMRRAGADGNDGNPGGAPAYNVDTRAASFTMELGQLDVDYRAGLADCRSNILVTTHAAFGYLADRYGLRQEPITGLSPEGEPDPARLAEIEDLIRAEHVTTVFTEPLASSDVADTIARETGTKVAVLNPIEGLTDAERANGDDYFSIMRTNLETLRGALGCT